MTDEFRFTDAEWRDYQAMPEQGYSHRYRLEFHVNRWLAEHDAEKDRRIAELESRLRADIKLMDIHGIDGPGADAALAKHDRQVAEKAWDEGMVASVNADLGDWENPPDLPTNPYRASSNTRPEGDTMTDTREGDKVKNATPREGDLRVWYIPQIPMKAFEVDLPTQDLGIAALVLDSLIGLSLFEFENKVKPDYADAAGIARFDGEDWEDVDADEWSAALDANVGIPVRRSDDR